MRVPLRLAALVASVALTAAPLTAQKGARTASRDSRPQSSCQSERLERVSVGDSEGRTRPSLDSLAAVIAFWFRPEFAPSVELPPHVLAFWPLVLEQSERIASWYS